MNLEKCEAASKNTPQKLNAAQAVALGKATQFPRPARRPADAYDYGDELTVGLHVKRNGYKLLEDSGENAFGLYLGKHDQQYVILTWGLLFETTGAEVFSTLDEMKAEWRLD